jgi:hypothetical protein
VKYREVKYREVKKVVPHLESRSFGILILTYKVYMIIYLSAKNLFKHNLTYLDPQYSLIL